MQNKTLWGKMLTLLHQVSVWKSKDLRARKSYFMQFFFIWWILRSGYGSFMSDEGERFFGKFSGNCEEETLTEEATEMMDQSCLIEFAMRRINRHWRLIDCSFQKEDKLKWSTDWTVLIAASFMDSLSTDAQSWLLWSLRVALTQYVLCKTTP